jgi:hypothetical protein
MPNGSKKKKLAVPNGIFCPLGKLSIPIYQLIKSLKLSCHCLTNLGAFPALPGTFFTGVAIEFSTRLSTSSAYFSTNCSNFPYIFRFGGAKAGTGYAYIDSIQTQLMALFHIRFSQMLVPAYSARGYGLIACVNACLRCQYFHQWFS